jgi:hypothetical protein
MRRLAIALLRRADVAEEKGRRVSSAQKQSLARGGLQ